MQELWIVSETIEYDDGSERTVPLVVVATADIARAFVQWKALETFSNGHGVVYQYSKRRFSIDPVDYYDGMAEITNWYDINQREGADEDGA